MNQTPLLPRSCELLVGGLGERNSRWSWTSPKLSLLTSVLVSSPSLRTGTVIALSASAHALPVGVQPSMDLPSNSITASDGGAPGVAPGVTTKGWGRSAS